MLFNIFSGILEPLGAGNLREADTGAFAADGGGRGFADGQRGAQLPPGQGRVLGPGRPRGEDSAFDRVLKIRLLADS